VDKTPAERMLVLVLRLFGCVDLLAFLAVLLPQSWMAKGHLWAGLGELPPGPLVGYLCRSAAFLYGLHGAVVFFISFDLVRYWRLITFLAVAALVHGGVMLAIDLSEEMPLWWTAVEGPAITVTGAVVLLLQGRIRSQARRNSEHPA
jgi:hypothetical protein